MSIVDAAFAALSPEEWADGALFRCPDDPVAAHYLRHVARLPRPQSGMAGVTPAHARTLMRQRAAVYALMDMGLSQREAARRLGLHPSAVLRAVRAREEAHNG